MRGMMIAVAVLIAATSAAFAQGAKTSGDYPGIGRFEGSEVIGQEVRDFDEVTLQAKPFKNNQPTDARKVEGKVTRIAYRAPAGA